MILIPGDCEKPGFASISTNESLLQNIKKLVVARGNSSTADPIIYILCGDMTEKVGGFIFKDEYLLVISDILV